MNSCLVLDTSVIIKWVRRGEVLADPALDLLNAYLAGHIRILVPHLLAYEVGNVLRYKPELTTPQIETALQALFDLDLDWVAPSAAMTRRAVAIARDYETSVYDASFAALAESVGGTLITADERLARRMSPLTYVTSLGDLGMQKTA
ncbi:MAG: type II toxin-antitoxin system VapC family toxin [Anaerolineae bacterium]|nr:type II toxin-antitoxin system VapC family toxin [Anaerolineae bacterium]